MLTSQAGFIRALPTLFLCAFVPLVAQVEQAVLGKRLDAALATAHKATGVPAISAAIVVGDRIVWAAGIGERCAGSDRVGNAVDAETRFQAASISKPITAMAVMKLKAQGKLDLDKPLAELPGAIEIERAEGTGDAPLTLRRLLSHTGGTTVHGFPGYASSDKMPSLADVLAGKGNTDKVLIDLPVGAQHRYSGGGYCVVQKVLMESCEQPFAQLMGELVLRPLGMKHSVYAQPLPKGLWEQAAVGHRDGKPFEHRWFVHPELAAAGMWTTASDLLRALLAMRAAELGDEGAFLPKEVATEMLTVQEKAERFGLGWMVRRQGDRWMYGHSGGNQGFLCDARLAKMGDQTIGFAVMINCEKQRALGEIIQALMAVARAQGGR